jgi:hypothetical protein
VAGLAISNIIPVKLFAFGPLALPTAVIVSPATRINRRRGHRCLRLLCRPLDPSGAGGEEGAAGKGAERCLLPVRRALASPQNAKACPIEYGEVRPLVPN